MQGSKILLTMPNCNVKKKEKKMDIRILGVCNLENENFQNSKVALNPTYRFFFKNCQTLRLIMFIKIR